jgi:S1-C subfamily serine protease
MSRLVATLALALLLGGCAGKADPSPAASVPVEDPYTVFYRHLHPSVVLFTMKIPADDPKRKGAWDDAYGSGVVVASGTWGSRILTDAHVIEDARDLRATVGDRGRPVRTRLVARSNDDVDLALVDIPTPDVPAVSFAEPDAVQPGLPVGVLGYPIPDAFDDEHLRQTVSLYTGRVASVRNGTIELDAPIIPGESGGPVFDGRTGRVIGLAESRFDDERAIGFATPLDVVLPFVAAHPATKVAPPSMTYRRTIGRSSKENHSQTR